MHTRTSKFVLAALTALVACSPLAARAQTCTAQICGATFCSTPTEDTKAFRTVDEAFILKLTAVSNSIMNAISDMDAYVARAVAAMSTANAHAVVVMTDDLKKTMEVTAKERQDFAISQKTLEAEQMASPSPNLLQETQLKTQWPMSEALTRATRQQLYEDHTRRTDLMHDAYYTDQTNIDPDRSYDRGTINGIAKLYATHKAFFCNAAGAQKPPGCGDDATEGVTMGDQMLDIYLGDRTWPKLQVQRSIELMQFYLGIKPPELKNPADLRSAEGQRDYITYQGQLARNNFLTYIMSYLVAKRAPTNTGQAAFVEIRKTAAGCANVTADNKNLCGYLDSVAARDTHASRAELSKALEFDRFMSPAYSNSAISGTMGIEKDNTLLMVDRLQQDYEAYQMERMETATLAAYYASLVGGGT